MGNFFTAIFGNKPNKTETINQQQVAEAPQPVDYVDDLELVAAITAAIASCLNVTTDKFIVRSIKPMNNWNAAAKRDVYFGGDIR